MSHRIQYAVNRDDGRIVSRVGSMLAWPTLNYAKIGQDGDYTAPLEYTLRKISVLQVGREWSSLTWTRRIPIALKNEHRRFWGIRELPLSVEPEKLHRDFLEHWHVEPQFA